jgi:hypothetical protein
MIVQFPQSVHLGSFGSRFSLGLPMLPYDTDCSLDSDGKGMPSANIKNSDINDRALAFSSAFLKRLSDVMQMFDGRLDFSL